MNTTLKAKRLIRKLLRDRGYKNRVSARKRDSMEHDGVWRVVVIVHDWSPSARTAAASIEAAIPAHIILGFSTNGRIEANCVVS